MSNENPEIGLSINAGGVTTNYHDVGQGDPVLLIHGSGPGVSAWANWRLTIGALSGRYRMLAPDMLGFGYSDRATDGVYSRERWLEQLVGFLDTLKLDKVHVIGNSFGGSMALALAIAHPERVSRLVTMGAVGVPFELTEGLDAVWGYEPSFENMKAIMAYFAYNQNLIGDDLIELRYKASAREGVQEAYAAMFPAPRQRWVEAMAHPEAAIRAIPHETLIIHGRDDKVIPTQTSLTMLDWIPNSQLHIFGHCGHWTQIEQAARFTQLVGNFFDEGKNGR
ncbi:alpha/beta fold hydrolase [Novosphingobium malaysiense]|uniref:2-hydroxy-6-oxo-2,4-heptadienoate hydrolase n=1 Tax=Novosphingobium malaysiense TaxID=1348853 RepID=A0A0B1ZME9_9SPHN|nr:alpha/beta hydrolase [Novosphingobium malaysiense]KHK90363.1 2-hydroxy-6-oxo-2,4-heptadienoate hydrolase [Novosphingobium malaysiense]